MNIINIEHISKLFGDKLIFDDASFGLQEGDKVGIVRINGTGKSTLLRMVAGEETPDSGQIIRQNNLKMAYLPQTPEFPKDATVLSYALSGDEEEWQVQSNLVQLGITEYDAKLDTLSGGQRRKVALAKVLASDFDVLILDEPTNHLDNAMLSWLEDYLKNYRRHLPRMHWSPYLPRNDIPHTCVHVPFHPWLQDEVCKFRSPSVKSRSLKIISFSQSHRTNGICASIRRRIPDTT